MCIATQRQFSFNPIFAADAKRMDMDNRPPITEKLH